ncbi:MAG: hypothetical protein U0802_08375 [Candidatus Binatia bacterium]
MAQADGRRRRSHRAVRPSTWPPGDVRVDEPAVTFVDGGLIDDGARSP